MIQFLISVAFLFVGFAANACVNFSGVYGTYTTQLKIEQKGCEVLTISGSEPVTNFYLGTGLNQPIDDQFHEFLTDGGNRSPYLVPKPNELQYTRFKLKLRFEGKSLELHRMTRWDANSVWKDDSVRTFTFINGRLRYEELTYLPNGKNYYRFHFLNRYKN